MRGKRLRFRLPGPAGFFLRDGGILRGVPLDKSTRLCYNRPAAGLPTDVYTGCGPMVRRLVWDQDFAGSIPVTPTKNQRDGSAVLLVFDWADRMRACVQAAGENEITIKNGTACPERSEEWF